MLNWGRGMEGIEMRGKDRGYADASKCIKFSQNINKNFKVYEIF